MSLDNIAIDTLTTERNFHRNEALVLRRNFAKYLARKYVAGRAVEIADLCDTELDPSGALLGYVRDEAGKLKTIVHG